MNRTNYVRLYWWIANLQEKGQRAPAHVEFLRAHLSRAEGKLGEAPNTILCNPADRDALADLTDYTIATRDNILPGNFWIDVK